MNDMLAKNLAFLLGPAYGASQEAIAKAVGATQPTISKWANLGTRNPEFRSMALLARHLGVSLDDLAWRDLERDGASPSSQSTRPDDATMAQALELLYLMADARPEDARLRRPSWATIQTAAKAIKVAEGDVRKAMAEFLAELV